MLYKEISALLAGVASDAERIRVLSSDIQDQDAGIIDGVLGTDCDKSYFERDYGLYDVATSLYNVFSGRDPLTDTTIKIGTATFSSTSTIFSGGLNVTGNTILLGDLSLGALDTATFYDTEFETESNHNAGIQLRDSAGIRFQNYGFSGSTEILAGDPYQFCYISARDVILKIPDTIDYYQTLGSGGAWKLSNQDRVALCVSALGRVSIGDLDEDDPSDDIGFFALTDDATATVGGDVIFQGSTKATDNRTSSRVLLRAVLNHETNPAVSGDIDMVLSATTVDWLFRKDAVTAFSINDVGDFRAYGDGQVDGNLTADIPTTYDELHVGTDAVVNGTLTVSGANVNANSATINCASISMSADTFSVGEVLDYIAITHSASGNYVDFRGAGIFAKNGFLSLVDANAYVFQNTLPAYRFMLGTGLTPTGPTRISLDCVANTNVSSITFGNYGDAADTVFTDVQGCVSVTDSTSGTLGPITSGADIAKYDLSTSIDFTNQTALDGKGSITSKEIEGAVIILKDANDSKYKHVVYDGANWIQMY